MVSSILCKFLALLKKNLSTFFLCWLKITWSLNYHELEGLTCFLQTRLLDRRGHSLSQHTQFLKMRMIFFWNFDTLNRTNTLTSCSLRSRAFCASRSRKFSKKKVCLNRLKMLWNAKQCKKKKIYPFDRLRASRVAQSPSGVAQWNFNTINRT